MDINVPPGVDNGLNMRLQNKVRVRWVMLPLPLSSDCAVPPLCVQGDAGENGGPNGHLYVEIRVKVRVLTLGFDVTLTYLRQPDPFFERHGADVHVKVPISFPQAALGDTLTIPTLKGEVELKVRLKVPLALLLWLTRPVASAPTPSWGMGGVR